MIKEILKKSLLTTIKTTTWLLKIILPVTLLVSICDYMGWIAAISEYATPLFALMGMKGEAAIPFITSVLTNLYAAIAVMASMSLDFRTVTILASMCLIAHNIIVECKIQQKAGSPIFYTAPMRIATALLAGYLLNIILPAEFTGTLLMPIAKAKYLSFMDMIIGWIKSSAMLVVQMVIIIFIMNLFQGFLRKFNIIDKLAYPLAPLMIILGLPRSTSILWIISNTLGITYGGMAIVEELERGYVNKKDAQLMNSSIAITHSLIEDSFLFIAIGVGAVWVFIPRIILSIFVVNLHKLFRILSNKK